MFPAELHSLFMWIAIISLVILATLTGMYINRFFIYRAHRQALTELRKRIVDAMEQHQESEQRSQDIERTQSGE